MKILHVIGGLALDWGGPSRVVREMAAHLAALGHDVTIASSDVAPGGRRARLGDEGQPDAGPDVRVRVHRADVTAPPYPSIALLADVLRHAREFDVAHVHGLFNAPVTSAMWALRARGVPYVVRPCGMLDPWSLRERATIKALYYRAAGVGERANLVKAGAIQVSTAHEESAVARLGLDVPLVRLPQGVGRDAVPAEALAASPWPRPYVLFLGRVARKKGLATLVEAMRTLDLDMVIVGPDELGHGAELDRLNDARAHRVHRVGAERDPARKAAWYAHAAAFALPSEDENFGLAVVEAAQRGTPVVVSDQVGLAPEVAADGAGIVVTRDVAAVRAALVEVVARGRSAYADGTARFAARFDWPPLAHRLEALYRRLASGAEAR